MTRFWKIQSTSGKTVVKSKNIFEKEIDFAGMKP